MLYLKALFKIQIKEVYMDMPISWGEILLL